MGSIKRSLADRWHRQDVEARFSVYAGGWPAIRGLLLCTRCRRKRAPFCQPALAQLRPPAVGPPLNCEDCTVLLEIRFPTLLHNEFARALLAAA